MENNSPQNKLTNIDVLIIGGGQAGLAAGFYLNKANIPFVIVDSNMRVGDSWRKRWDSLELFTPRPFAALPGMKVSKKYSYYPKKDEIADYFESYANTFKLPIHLGSNVSSVIKNDTTFITQTDQHTYHSKNIIVATGPFNQAYVPDYAQKLDRSVQQIHSSMYKNPNQIESQMVTIVGGGNSATQLAEELFAAGKEITLISSRMPWFLPKTILNISSYWWFYLSGALHADANSKISKYVRGRGDGIIGFSAKKLIQRGFINHEISRVVEASSQSLIMANEKQLPVSSVIWATGFKPNYDWLKITGTHGARGEPLHAKGVSPAAGVFWVGLPWQSKMNSGIINGVGSDAEFIINHIQYSQTKDKGSMHMQDIIDKVTNGHAILLDVRTEAEWNEGHAKGAVHIPVDDVDSEHAAKLDIDIPIYVYCGSGKRASVAKTTLEKNGYQAVNIGGLSDWKNAGGETIRGQQ